MSESGEERLGYGKTEDRSKHSRRDVLTSAALFAGSMVGSSPAYAADSAAMSALGNFVSPQAESAGLESGLLESRVTSNVLNPPPYGMEGADVYYPS